MSPSIPSGSIAATPCGLPALEARLRQDLASLFYREDIGQHFERLQAYAEPEVFGDEWQRATPPGSR